MAIVHFYEKPGCINNSRQKQMLAAAGHQLVVYDLLQFPWGRHKDQLRDFFADLPVAEWFNRSAPAVKNGTVIPEQASEQQALDWMVADPLLIRRPLMEADGKRRAGFDPVAVDAWLGLAEQDAGKADDLETCPKTQHQQACRP